MARSANRSHDDVEPFSVTDVAIDDNEDEEDVVVSTNWAAGNKSCRVKRGRLASHATVKSIHKRPRVSVCVVVVLEFWIVTSASS
jgi:hypothetical protein